MKKNYFLMMLTCIFSLPAFAQVTVNLPAVKDNAIFSESVNNSSGAGMLFVGQTCTNNQRRTFMQFDPSSIPSGATINSVSLTVTSNNVSNGAAGGELFTIYGLQTNFGEGTSVPTGGSGAPAVAPDATWNANMFGTSLWTNPGGDFVPIPASTSNFPATTGAHVFPSTSILVSLMNSWINTPANNFGLMLAGQVSSTCTARRLDSRETGTAPFLTVTYTPCAATSGTDVQTACDSYTWSNGITYIADNNTAKDTLVNAAGCDSIVTLDLTILNSTSSTDVHTACTSFLWIDGTTYTASNTTATHTINNAAGCDSVITLNLTINDATTGTDVISSCGPISWIDGNTYSSSNNSATFTLNNANGCDSVVTLDFTLGGSFGITDVQTACDAYTWLDGTTYTSSNNTAIHTVTVPGGCDTVYTLNLTLNNSSTGTDVQTACDSYNWIDGNTYTASNTTATHTLTNAAGCDSVVTLNLTINNSSSSIDVQEACDSYTWIDGLTYTASNNSATVTLTNAAGCDSVVTLDLTVTTIDLTVSLTTGTTTTSILSNTAGASYQWLDCDNGNAAISGETGQAFTATGVGSYAVVVSLNNCTDTSDCVDVINVGISDNFIEEQVSIFPNPNAGMVFMDFGSLTGLSFKVFNTLGQMVLEENNLDSSQYKLELKGEAGLYFVEVNAEGKLAYFKLVKK